MERMDRMDPAGDSARTDTESDTDAAEHAAQAADELELAFKAARNALARNAVERPYTTAAAALGVGYVLGGGIPTWAVRMAVNTATRAAIAGILVPRVLGGGDDD